MNRVMPWIARASIIAVALVMVDWLLGLALPADQIIDDATGLVGRLGLRLLSALLLAAPLAFPLSRSRLTGWSLFGAVFVAAFGLTTVLTQVEAALFLDMTPQQLLAGTLKGGITSATLAWLAVTLYPRATEHAGAEHAPNPPTTASWVRRWIGVSLAYTVLYIVAGLLIVPIIRSWYEAQGTLDQNPALVLPLQMARGALFVACLLPLLRSMSVTRRQAALALAVMIPLVHGVSALIVPNPYMPAYVRHAHMLEIGWSNVALGLLIGFLFWNPRPCAKASMGT